MRILLVKNNGKEGLNKHLAVFVPNVFLIVTEDIDFRLVAPSFSAPSPFSIRVLHWRWFSGTKLPPLPCVIF